uniref:Uncharacterized protein n=1 Tax=Thermosporothrix sp. COM3 TaxID=2490863 RepID=A0A455SGB1_9CHLR|nr:hypothetical protein KTC_15470 [Thermosporothrix sp. COM3]
MQREPSHSMNHVHLIPERETDERQEVEQLRAELTEYQQQIERLQMQLRESFAKAPPERGRLLTVWLLLLSAFYLVNIWLVFMGHASTSQLLIGTMGLIGIVGTWQFKKWGYGLLLITYALGLLQSCALATVAHNTPFALISLIATLIGAAVISLLVSLQWDDFS